LLFDLHVHTTASDGSWGPTQVARGAKEGGLDAFAIADHDTTAGVVEAASAAEGLRIIPAVELSTTRDGRELHVLAYFIDPDATCLRNHEKFASEARTERMRTMLARLERLGIHIDLEAVLEIAGAGGRVLGRPHLARAIVNAGHADTIEEAFGRYIGDGLPAFEPTALMDPIDAVKLAHDAGGFAVWAHPPSDMIDSVLPGVVKAGLKGIEVYRPLSTPEQIKRLEGISKSAGLLRTGGSDWHSPERNGRLGDFAVTQERLSAFLEAGRF
jgi:3',5'-nucleoside bisphosphate phosphatase